MHVSISKPAPATLRYKPDTFGYVSRDGKREREGSMYFLLEPVPQACTPMGFAGPFVGRGCGIATHHLARPPSGQPHEILFLVAISEPAVCERVAKLMRVNVVD